MSHVRTGVWKKGEEPMTKKGELDQETGQRTGIAKTAGLYRDQRSQEKDNPASLLLFVKRFYFNTRMKGPKM